MRAISLTAFEQPYTLVERPVPSPGAGEVLLRVLAVGVCGTDVKLWKGLLPGTPLPLVPGHEIAAVVAGLGDGVEAPPPGTRVVVLHHLYCGTCPRCAEGLQNLCVNLRGRVGFDHDGGMADYVVVPAENVVELPAGVPAAAACVVPDAVATTWRAVVTLAKAGSEDTLAVLGAGGLGLSAIQIARLRGVPTVLAVDVAEDKLRAAAAAGATHVALAGEAASRARELPAGAPTCVIDCAGSPAALELAGTMLPSRGLLVQVGYTPGTRLGLQSADVALKELRVLGCRAAAMPDLLAAVAAVGAGSIAPPVATELPLEAAPEALAAVAGGTTAGRQALIVGSEPG